MSQSENTSQHLLTALQERAKELECLYRIDEILDRPQLPFADVCQDLLLALPPGWKYPEVCRGRINLNGETWSHGESVESAWSLKSDIVVQGETVGEIAVIYIEEMPKEDEGPFLQEERRLIDTIAQRISLFLLQGSLRRDHDSWKRAVKGLSSDVSGQWKVLLEFLSRTDPQLLKSITKKMINHLCWTGVQAADELLEESLQEFGSLDAVGLNENCPIERTWKRESETLNARTFALAAQHLSESDVMSRIQAWISEHKSTFLIKSLENPGSGLAELSDAVERYKYSAIDERDLSTAVCTSLKVALLRRFFVDQLDFINVAKNFVEIRDFYDLVQCVIYPDKSQGKLGGKGAGLFLATQILRRSTEYSDVFGNLSVPKTWYIASDGVLNFIQYNNLSEVYNRKYMDVERVRLEYPYIIQLFKNSDFPPEITKGLAAALDDFGNSPLIVRSSSLLEDRVGTSFSGKYKSLFLANQGEKKDRLEALKDAIAEVYASVFGPDPIEYRAENGLIDFREEMGILIQEVVGDRVGKYLVPAYSGVAFSNNDYPWSPRIKRADGLVRIVPGLGTRAVDRLTDDYPVIFAPGQPGLRANVTADEIVRYSPRKIDVIDLEWNSFATIDVQELLREHGDEYPLGKHVVSLVEGDHIRQPIGLEPDWMNDDYVVTFEGLLREPAFISRLQALLKVLREKIGMPVDIEFAATRDRFYLVQCRVQSRSEEYQPAPIPRDLPQEDIVFSANRYVTNGRIPDITHIVYVDGNAYGSMTDLQQMKDVGRAVGRLNKLLPHKQFILIGPGRWGSRGDVKLGVSVTYSDINNTAALLEVAWRKGGYLPELSFGTHFFQDLVEADIRYIPLYPDDEGVAFNELFLLRTANSLPDLLPRYAHLSDVLHVIDVPKNYDGRIFQLLLNADLEEAVGVVTERSASETIRVGQPISGGVKADLRREEHWQWRQQMAQKIAESVDPGRFGVKAMYVFGSTKNATSGPGSDLDLLVHFGGNEAQRKELEVWLEGWSLSLAESNYLRTGYRSQGLLDVHFVTDDDIRDQTSFAIKIGAVTDAARLLPMGSD
jgi:pyruvate, water dikinase